MNTLTVAEKRNEIISEKSFISAHQDQSALREQDVGSCQCYPTFTQGFNFQDINLASFTNTELLVKGY